MTAARYDRDFGPGPGVSPGPGMAPARRRGFRRGRGGAGDAKNGVPGASPGQGPGPRSIPEPIPIPGISTDINRYFCTSLIILLKNETKTVKKQQICLSNGISIRKYQLKFLVSVSIGIG